MKGAIRFCLGFLVVLGSVGTVEITPVLTAAQLIYLSVSIIVGTVIMWSGASALSKNQGLTQRVFCGTLVRLWGVKTEWPYIIYKCNKYPEKYFSNQ